MKRLMLGNEAIARGLYEAGVTFVSSYPGTPSTEITEFAAKYPEIHAEWAPNEKVAYESALGASIAGARSATAMKHVGLNVAADPMFTSAYTGINGGFVAIVADDPAMHSSQNEQDSRHYARAAKLPMLEPSDSAECRDFTAQAFEISEQFDTPVLIRTCTRVAHAQNAVGERPRAEIAVRPYQKDARKYVMAPGNAIHRHPIVEARLSALAEYSERSALNREELGDRETGFVCSGACYLYIKEVFPNASVLKLGMTHPLPMKKIASFAEKVSRLIVVEELDGVIETELRAAGVRVDGGKDLFSNLGELSQAAIRRAMGVPAPESARLDDSIPLRPPVMCAGCPHRGVFYTLGKMKLTVLGDIGCYTLGAAVPLGSLETCICMGSSISSLHGFATVRPGERDRTVCVIGDSTFLHSGITSLTNIAYNQSRATVLILDNSITGMTGHQQNPATGCTLQMEAVPPVSLEKLCEAVGIRRVRVVDPGDLALLEAALAEELAADEASVIICRRPCMLLKTAVVRPALSVDAEKCRGCKKCMKLGCPAISVQSGRAAIDSAQCVGCGLCGQLCAFGAIGEAK